MEKKENLTRNNTESPEYFLQVKKKVLKVEAKEYKRCTYVKYIKKSTRFYNMS